MKKVLITGGAGYIASHLIKELLKVDKISISVIDNFKTGFLKTIKTLQTLGEFNFTQLDLSNFEVVKQYINENKFDTVIHFAASSIVSDSMKDPINYYMNNTVNSINLIKCCSQNGIKNFIFSSTAAVYGDIKSQHPIKETTATNPINPYGRSKLFIEKILQDESLVNKEFNFGILRYFNVAGADFENKLGECHEPETHLIPLVAKVALGKIDSISIYGNDYKTIDGTCIRDYIHVVDLAYAHIEVINYLEAGNNSDIFNCGYGHGFSVKEVIHEMKNISNNNFLVKKELRREGDPDILIADNKKILKKTNWTPKFDDLKLICSTALKWENTLI